MPVAAVRTLLLAFLIGGGALVSGAAAEPSGQQIRDVAVLAQPVPFADAVRSAAWQPVARIPGGAAAHGWWLRFRLADLSSSNWYLYPGRLDVVELFDTNGTQLARTGYAVPFAQRPVSGLLPMLRIPDAFRGDGFLYMRITGPIDGFDGSVLAIPNVVSFDSRLWNRFAVVVGSLGTILLYQLILGLLLRDRPSLAYVVSCLSFVIYETVDLKVAWQVVWPTASVPLELAVNLAFIVFLAGRTFFIRTFVPLRRLAPLADTIFIAAIGVMMVIAAGYAFLTAPMWTYVNAVAGLVAVTAAIAGMTVCARQGSREARFALIAFGTFGTCAVAGLLTTELHVLPDVWVLDHALEIGVCLEAVLLSFALADRIRHADRQRMEAQRESLEVLRRHNSAVSRFLPAEFLEYLGWTDVTQVSLGDHVLRRMTVLFADIRAFTTLSEALTPDETFRFLNSYLSHLGPVIREHHGFIDKFIGDAIMGLFPGSADDGVRAAVALHQQLALYNNGRIKAGFDPIACGVGLHRGDLMLGTVGEAERMDTTVIADVVNLASRLEGLTKLYGARIIVSEAVVAELERPEAFTFRDLGLIAAKGKSQATRVFEVLDADDGDLRTAKLAGVRQFAAALEAFKAGSFGEASGVFSALTEANPLDRAAAHYMRRSRELAQAAPGTWDGVDHILTK